MAKKAQNGNPKPKGKKLLQTLRDPNGKPLATLEKELLSTGEPPYFKAYVTDLIYFLDISKSNYRILSAFMTHMTYDNMIHVNPIMKQEIQEGLHIKNIQSINNCFSDLCKKGLLMRIRRGSYFVNPNYFARGGWNDIKEIRSTITYNETGRMVQVIIEKKEPNIQPNNDFYNENGDC